MAPPIPIYLDDTLRMRKPHTCSGPTWRVVWLRAEIGMRCLTCGRKVLLPRAEFAHRVKRFSERGPAAAASSSPPE